MSVEYQKNQFVRDIKDKDAVAAPFIVKTSSVAVGKNGKPYMNLVLADKTGEVEARIWSNVTQYASIVVQDALVQIKGRCQLFQGRRQVVVEELSSLREDGVNLKDFLKESTLDAEALYSQLMVYMNSMQDPHYKALAEIILKEDEDIVSRLKRAPAAKSMHHAYPTGLLEHIVSITGILDLLAKHYQPYLNRDLLFLGGFFHDIGKLWELTYDRITDYSDEGRLVGHLVMGVELVNDKIRLLEEAPGKLPSPFPKDKKLLVKHLILAHHGELEYGSPKRPKCLEALVVHYIDDLDSKVNAISQFIKQDQSPGQWTALNRNFERYFTKPDWAKNPDAQI